MNPVIKSLCQRKSCRSFKPQHISKEEMDTIIEAGLNAPSGLNMQTQILVAVSDDQTVSILSKLNADITNRPTDPFYGAKDVIIVLVKKEGTYKYDGPITMGNMLNAAWSMGIGSCWIHRAKEVFEGEDGKALLKKWGITDDVEGVGFCILGYPDQEKPKTEIKPNRVYYVD